MKTYNKKYDNFKLLTIIITGIKHLLTGFCELTRKQQSKCN